MKQKTALALTIYSVCFVVLLYMIPSVAVAGLLAAFPGHSQATVLLLLTLPNLTGVAGILAMPVLGRRFSQRQLTLAALWVLLATGFASLAFHRDLPLLIGAAGVMGVSFGMLSTLFPLLVNAHFTGEAAGKVMGIASGMFQLGRVTAVLVAGVLAERGWQNVYWCFALVLVPLAFSLRFLPKHDPAPVVQPGRKTDWCNKKGVAALGVVGFTFAALYYLSSTHTSLYIEGYGLGTASTTGALTALAGVVGGLLSVSYGWLRRCLGPYSFALALGLLGLGYLASAASVSLVGAAACALGPAIGMALFSPAIMLSFADNAGGKYLPTVTALVLTLINVGYFASPYVTGTLALLGPGQTPAALFLITGLASLAAACVIFLKNLLRKPRRAE